MGFVDALPSINAALNATSAVLLFAGWRAIKRRRISAHWKLMLAAFATSTLFLVFYLTRFYLTGTHKFHGEAWLKAIYLTILFSHMILAAILVPLVLRTLFLAAKRRFTDHRKIVRYTFPIWAYVSVTGVIVYVMLYHVSG